jgi:hypothetical protein
MLEGVYDVRMAEPAAIGPALIILDEGRISGLGHFLGTYTGTYQATADGVGVALELEVKVPAAVQILNGATGIKSGPAGSSVLARGDGQVIGNTIAADLDMLGQTVRVVLAHVGCLPQTKPEQVPGRGFRSGLYRGTFGGASYVSRAVIAGRSGRFAGSGELGAFYQGTLNYDQARDLCQIDGTAEYLPHTPLVTGSTIGHEGAKIPFHSEGKLVDNVARFSISMAGRAVDIHLELMQPLPV